MWEAPLAGLSLESGIDRAVVSEMSPVPSDPATLRRVFSQFPTGIAAVCAEVDGTSHGMVITSFTVGASFDPPLVLFSAQSSSRTWPVLASAKRIGISVLSDRNRDVVGQLASRGADRFHGVETATAPGGAVFILRARVWLDCSLRSTSLLGDHELAVLEVHRVSGFTSAEPLVYHDGDIR